MRHGYEWSERGTDPLGNERDSLASFSLDPDLILVPRNPKAFHRITQTFFFADTMIGDEGVMRVILRGECGIGRFFRLAVIFLKVHLVA
jgi:hypothetical protein